MACLQRNFSKPNFFEVLYQSQDWHIFVKLLCKNNLMISLSNTYIDWFEKKGSLQD